MGPWGPQFGRALVSRGHRSWGHVLAKIFTHESYHACTLHHCKNKVVLSAKYLVTITGDSRVRKRGGWGGWGVKMFKEFRGHSPPENFVIWGHFQVCLHNIVPYNFTMDKYLRVVFPRNIMLRVPPALATGSLAKPDPSVLRAWVWLRQTKQQAR